MEHWVKRGGQRGRRLDSQQLSSTTCLCVFKLCGGVPTVFYVHTHTQLRVTRHGVLPLVLQFSPFANQFPFFIQEHFLVYGSYEGEVWLKGRAPLFPLSLVQDQNPFGSKLVVSLISHLGILVMNLCSLPVNIKIDACSYLQQNHTNAFTYAVFLSLSFIIKC